MRTRGTHAPHVLTAGTSIEVRCHLNCPWSTGFEVEEAVLVNDQVSYRIRRAESGRALPTPFGADYVRRQSLGLALSGRGRRELERPST